RQPGAVSSHRAGQVPYTREPRLSPAASPGRRLVRRLQSIHLRSLPSLKAFHVPRAGRTGPAAASRRKTNTSRNLWRNICERSVTPGGRLRRGRWWSAGRKMTTSRKITDQKDRADHEMHKTEKQLSRGRSPPGRAPRAKLQPGEGTFRHPELTGLA